MKTGVGAERSVRFGEYRFHPVQGLTRRGRDLRVTPKSLAVLEALLARPGEVVTKDELFRSVWPDTSVSDAALTSCIQELRRAFTDDARRPRFIETAHRRGFRFLPACSPDESAALAVAPRARQPGASGPIVGRETAFRRLSDALSRAAAGDRQVVFATGAPGIGKTTLIDAWLAAAGSACRVARAECFEQHGAGEAYQPLLDALVRLCALPDGESCMAALRQFGPTWLAQLPVLQLPAEHASLRRRTAGATPERMLRELTDVLESISRRLPIVLCLDDLHWSDSSTLDWLSAFARRPEPARVLVIGTYRPGGPSRLPSPTALADDLGVKGLCLEIRLEALDARTTADYVMARFPPAPDAAPSLEALAALVYARTEGNPLFLVSVLDDLIARQVVIERGGGWVASDRRDAEALAIPSDVRRAIERQVERLTPTDQRLLEVASVAVGDCTVAAVAAATGIPDGDVESAFDSLDRRQAFLRAGPIDEWPDGTWTATFEFRHSLYRDVLNARLPASRRADAHRAMGARLESAYAGRTTDVALELAVHFEQARDFPRAVHYFEQAAGIARGRSAHGLAETHYRRALELLDRLPDGADRDAREMALQIGLGHVLMQTSGWGDAAIEAAYARVRLLSERRDAGHQLPALWNLWIFYTTRGDLAEARSSADRLSMLAEQSGDLEWVLQAHHAQWSTLFTIGDLGGAERHARRGIELTAGSCGSTLTFGSHDAGICARLFRARVLALSGRPDSAAALCDEALRLAREFDHPFTLAFTLMHVAAVHESRRDADAVRRHAAEATDVARDHGFSLMFGWATCFLGWSLVQTGDVRAGRVLIEDGVAAASAARSVLFQPHMLGLLATAQAADGLRAEARQSVARAIDVSGRTGERFYLPELYRVQGELRWSESGTADGRALAASDFRTAIRLAEEYGAASLALRAVVSLVRARGHSEGTAADSLASLIEARRRVTEGTDLADVREAVALIGGDPLR